MEKKTQFLKNKLKSEGLDAYLISKPANRRYLSDFTGTSGILVITQDEDIFLTDFRYIEQAGLQTRGFNVIQHEVPMTDTLKKVLLERGVKYVGIEKDYLTVAAYHDLVQSIEEVDFLPVICPCLYQRRIKSEQEILLLKTAIEIADKAFLHIIDFIHVGQTEKEAAFELEFFMKRLGSECNAFETIIASGERSALPHGVASSKTINQGDLVTLDYGAVFQGYHSDMTRTVAIKNAHKRQAEVYELVKTAQEAAIKGIQPGMKAYEADSIAREIIKNAGFGDNFGHGLGHGVGLEIHEGPRLAPSDETVLEPGMVVSVEPGVYIPGWGGVRIEDLILITSNGCEVLTKSPKDLLVIS